MGKLFKKKIKGPKNILYHTVLLTPEQHRQADEDSIKFKYFVTNKELTWENERLKQELDDLNKWKEELIEYLVRKLEESKLEGTYGGQAPFVTIQERIYKEVLDKVEGR